MQQGHKLDSNPQHLDYMAAGWEITSSPPAKLWQLVAVTGGSVWTRLWQGTSHRLEFDSLLRNIFSCQNQEGSK